MWIFTKYGFFSVVCARKNNVWNAEVDPNTMMIRARSQDHLKNLINNFSELKDFEIKTTHNSDYKYRIFVPKDIWIKISSQMSQEIDYDNFKNKVHDYLKDNEFYGCLSKIWGIMYNYQND